MKQVNRLYKTFQPLHYELHIQPDSTSMHFRGSVIITGKKTGRPNKRITLHQNGLTINSASITKLDKKEQQTVPVSRINLHKRLHEVRLHSDQTLYGGTYRLELSFEAPITRGMTGLYPCFFTQNNEERVVLATQFESHHAREVFPCIDEPEAKATYDVSITTGSNLTVLGNTPILTTSKINEDLTKTTFQTTPKMSSYLLAFVIGELHSTETKTNRGTEVRVWGTIAQPKESFSFALDVAKRSIEFFENYFKTPYPLEKADHVALPDFSSAAMENWGLVTYRESVLLLYPDAISQSSKELIATVITHETSHQWFGNLVTMRWWDDLWLNESFANMMEYLAVDALFPDWDIWESFVTAEGLSALRRDAVPGVQAVKTTVHHPDEISTLFDPSIVYAKGGRLLYMLKSYIGETAFRNGLQDYFVRHAYANTEGKDLWDALSKSSGLDIASFMNPWLERSGFPVLSVTQRTNSVSISQEHFLDDRAQADSRRVWPVPLFSDSASETPILDTKSTHVTLKNESYIHINQGSRGHYIVQYTEPEHREYFSKQIRNNTLGTVDRLSLLVDSTMLSRSGYQSFSETLHLLEAYKHEETEPVWDIIALVLTDTKRFVDYDESLDPAIKKLVRQLIQAQYNRLGWDEQPKESAGDQKLRATILGLGVYAEHPEIMAKAITLFDSFVANQASVPAELRSIIFSAAIKSKQPNAIDFLLDLHAKTHNSDLKRDISSGLTATKDPVTARKLLALIKNPAIVKPQDADRWFIYLLRNRHTRQEAWEWMEQNWQWIIETYKNDKSYDNFPRYAAMVCGNKEWEKRYHAFFEPKQSEPALQRNISIGYEEIHSRIAWIERDLSAVTAYFTARKNQ